VIKFKKKTKQYEMSRVPDHLKSVPTPEEPTDRAIETAYLDLKNNFLY